MKKILTLLMVLSCCSLSYAKTVSVNDAKIVGFNYLNQRGAAIAGINDLSLVYTSGTAPAYFYVFGNTKCFVLVAAEDGVTPILGYSNKNAFRGDHIPAQITSFFSSYNKQIDYVINNNVAATTEIATTWSNLANNVKPAVAAKTTNVSPLLNTTWDQYPYYNALCPADPGAGAFGGTDVTGCVATAMAQVMKFWNWPATGVGFNSYSTSSYGTLSANFATTTYNWASMPNSVSSPNNAVATLMYDAGVSVDMDYTSNESGAYVISSATGTPPYCAEYALKTFFNYVSTLHGEARASYSDAAWISMLQANLDAGEPIICSGDGSAGGHCFVFDGYETAGSMFDVNWGWSGSSDGYYTIDALNPPALGAGGGGGGFNSDQAAILGIKPNGTVVAATGMALASNISVSPASIYYGQAFSVTATVKNAGTTAFSGSYGALVFDASSTLVDSVQVLAGSLAPGATTPLLTFSSAGSLSLLPGTYTIVLYDRTAGSSWSVINSSGSYINSATLTVTNSSYIEMYSNMHATPAVLTQGSAATITDSLANESGALFASSFDFNDSVDVSLYNLDGSFACEVQSLAAVSIPDGFFDGPITFTTSNITAAPGTYLLVTEYKYSGNWYLAGTDLGYENPAFITVVAPPLSPDMYEVNNTAATAYDLTPSLTWVSNVASTGTPGANFHIATDQDYYKITLPAGYHYAITARVNDDAGSDDAITYTTDAIWSYSTDGGTTWSAVYDDVMPGTINIAGAGSVIFHCAPHNAGGTGTYLLKVSNITRTSIVSVPSVSLSNARIYPNPASEIVNIDLSGTNAKGIEASVTDMAGRKVYTATMNGLVTMQLPVSALAAGVYLITVTTDLGDINEKITVGK